MKTAIATLVSASPYSQSRHYTTDRSEERRAGKECRIG